LWLLTDIGLLYTLIAGLLKSKDNHMNTEARILIIDDDEAVLALLEGLLGLDGYKVLSAYDGIGGLCEVSLTKPVLIFLDMRLPLMDGDTFITMYHQTPPPHAPIIGMSAYADPYTNPGLAAFMKKPFDFVQFRRTFDAVLKYYVPS
jgi:CheY-like chemotaxis protein